MTKKMMHISNYSSSYYLLFFYHPFVQNLKTDWNKKKEQLISKWMKKMASN